MYLHHHHLQKTYFFIVAQWITHSKAVSNISATNFFPFNFFPSKIFPILCFFPLTIFFFSLIFFSYCKEKINWWKFLYIVQKLGDDNFFYLRLGWIFLLKHVCFYVSKMLSKKFDFFFIIQIYIYFLMFLYYFDVMI
jgi:hypothetical protein